MALMLKVSVALRNAGNCDVLVPVHNSDFAETFKEIYMNATLEEMRDKSFIMIGGQIFATSEIVRVSAVIWGY